MARANHGRPAQTKRGPALLHCHLIGALDEAHRFAHEWEGLGLRQQRELLSHRLQLPLERCLVQLRECREPWYCGSTRRFTPAGELIQPTPGGETETVVLPPLRGQTSERKYQRSVVVNAEGLKRPKCLMSECSKALPACVGQPKTLQQLFCSGSGGCYDKFISRKKGGGMRRVVEDRDKGVCAQCNVDANALFEKIKRSVHQHALRFAL